MDMDQQKLFNLRKFLVPEIVYGQGAIRLAGRHAINFGASKILVVSDPGVQKAGWTPKIEAMLQESGIPFVVFNEVTPNPKDHEVMAGAQVCIREGCDLILAVGGGSPMDCAKGIGVVVGNDRPILEFEGVDEIPKPGPPLIFIPTTAGTSADISQFAIITDTARKIKIAIVSKMVIPDIALVDPETTMTMSPELTAETGMDALCHAFEAFVSTASSPMTDMAALRAVELIASNLIGAYRNPQNYIFRDHMMMASLMAGMAFSNASLGLVHAMAHSLGGAFDIAHGQSNAMLLEKVVRFNSAVASEKYARLALTMNLQPGEFETGKLASALADHVAWIRKQLGIPDGLAELGINETDLPQLAANAANDPCLATNPRQATAEQIKEIYRELV